MKGKTPVTLWVEQRAIALDKDGYLKNLADWNERVADALAQTEAIKLTDAHWQIINIVRQFYAETGLSPATRPLINLIAEKAGAEKGKSIYLMRLFGGKPALSVSRIAGLPRPANCF
ncbi:TusE/DsrC/DsvC family sulfur relay protein [Pseudohongiella spirulinae]|uniref:Sulfurtransferase n=1 Tax=Pseudohongiella spirulinae TaxID=1249552 RepID=A0A0S2KD14_9GAMM|nr:TusE/DsrC/DsvC family sulfur relay protein [Pseudohongiella spirulinae]ALO46204.1 Sulfurtransferase [Pseudohongiella spirulinae]